MIPFPAPAAEGPPIPFCLILRWGCYWSVFCLDAMAEEFLSTLWRVSLLEKQLSRSSTSSTSLYFCCLLLVEDSPRASTMFACMGAWGCGERSLLPTAVILLEGSPPVILFEFFRLYGVDPLYWGCLSIRLDLFGPKLLLPYIIAIIMLCAASSYAFYWSYSYLSSIPKSQFCLLKCLLLGCPPGGGED